MTNYIRGKILESTNIDKTFKNIFKNFYVGYYLGFADTSNLINYKNFDLHDSYFNVFHNLTFYFICYISIIAFNCFDNLFNS